MASAAAFRLRAQRRRLPADLATRGQWAASHPAALGWQAATKRLCMECAGGNLLRGSLVFEQVLRGGLPTDGGPDPSESQRE